MNFFKQRQINPETFTVSKAIDVIHLHLNQSGFTIKIHHKMYQSEDVTI